MEQQSTTLRLCGSHQEPQCPTVTIDENGVDIRDDFGGSAHLTREEFALLLKEGAPLLEK